MATFRPVQGHILDEFWAAQGDDFCTTRADPEHADTAAPAYAATAAENCYNDATLDAEWASRPHLAELDLTQARVTLSPALFRRLKRITRIVDFVQSEGEFLLVMRRPG